MAKNPYFKYKDSESRLMEDLTIETIKAYGDDYIYIVRESFNRDYLFGEDKNSRFKDSIILEMYLKNFESNEGRDVLSKFGIEVKDRGTFVVSKRRFEESVSAFFPDIKRPREGDLIYSPLEDELYQIEFVENKVPFFQGNKAYTYELSCQTYIWQQESIETGMSKLDDLVSSNTNLLVYLGLTATGVTGATQSFLINETVYFGSTLQGATFSGDVVEWNPLYPLVVQLRNVSGDQSGIVGGIIKGSESGGELRVTADLGNTLNFVFPFPTKTTAENNDEIQRESRGIINFSDVDPFSEGRY